MQNTCQNTCWMICQKTFQMNCLIACLRLFCIMLGVLLQIHVSPYECLRVGVRTRTFGNMPDELQFQLVKPLVRLGVLTCRDWMSVHASHLVFSTVCYGGDAKSFQSAHVITGLGVYSWSASLVSLWMPWTSEVVLPMTTVHVGFQALQVIRLSQLFHGEHCGLPGAMRLNGLWCVGSWLNNIRQAMTSQASVVRSLGHAWTICDWKKQHHRHCQFHRGRAWLLVYRVWLSARARIHVLHACILHIYAKKRKAANLMVPGQLSKGSCMMPVCIRACFHVYISAIKCTQWMFLLSFPWNQSILFDRARGVAGHRLSSNLSNALSFRRLRGKFVEDRATLGRQWLTNHVLMLPRCFVGYACWHPFICNCSQKKCSRWCLFSL